MPYLMSYLLKKYIYSMLYIEFFRYVTTLETFLDNPAKWLKF